MISRIKLSGGRYTTVYPGYASFTGGPRQQHISEFVRRELAALDLLKRLRKGYSIEMSRQRTFGLLLFGGIVVLTVTRHSGFLRGIKSLRNSHNKISSSEVGPRGDFIVRGSINARAQGRSIGKQ